MPEIPLVNLAKFTVLSPKQSVFVNRPVHEGDVPLHQHDFVEIAMVINGKASHRTIGGVQRVRRGDVFVIHPGQWHAYEGCEGMHIFNCCFTAALLDHELSWLRDDPVLGPLVARNSAEQAVSTFSVDEAGIVTSLGITDRLRALTGASHLTTRGDTIALLLLMLSELARQRSRTPGREPSAVANHPAVSRAMTLLEEDLSRDWTLEEMARRLEIDRSHLIRIFRKRTGLTPMLWLARRRGELAAVRLLTTDAPIGDIGREVGWLDPNYFARRFRSLFGLSPREYRSQLPCPPAAVSPDGVSQW